MQQTGEGRPVQARRSRAAVEYIAPRGSFISCLAERAVLLARPGDLVILATHLDPVYWRYLQSLGIGPVIDDIVVLESDHGCASARPTPLLDRLLADSTIERVARRLDTSRTIRLNPYYASETVFEVARALSQKAGVEVFVDGGCARAVALSNRKDALRAQARRLGVPWPEGELVSWEECGDGFDPVAAMVGAVARVRTINGGVFVRGVRSMQGSDNLRLDNGSIDHAAMTQWLHERPFQRAFLVEPLLPIMGSPNVQLWINGDGSAYLLAITSQRLSERLSHRGNSYPHLSPALWSKCTLIFFSGLCAALRFAPARADGLPPENCQIPVAGRLGAQRAATSPHVSH